MLSHRRESQAQSDISSAPFLDPATSPAVLHGLTGLNPSPGIDSIDSSAVFVDDEASEMSFEPTREHPEACMLTVQKFRIHLLKLRSTAVVSSDITPEIRSMFGVLRQCLDLRDKYMAVSNQRLGDNPRDHDGVFHGIPEGISDVMSVRPEVAGAYVPTEEQFKPWRIYPRPPAPHWKWTADKEAVLSGAAPPRDVFDFSQVEIPGAHEWEFEIDDMGVYQVYHDTTGMSRPLAYGIFVELSISK